MATISRQTIRKALLVTALSAVTSVTIAGSLVPLFGGTYDGLGMWLSVFCPIIIAFPASMFQFHQSEQLSNAMAELSTLNSDLDHMHSNLMRAHAALKEKARTDAMTGALTREAFMAELNDASIEGRRGTLLLADADRFKHINDTYGHQTGDEALIAIARQIAGTIGPHDFWGRIGGEEFAIFLEGLTADDAFEVAETLRQRTEATDVRRGKERVDITISVGGVGVYMHFSVRQAIAEADRRLYRAKRSGRNRVVFDEACDDANVA